MTIVDVRCMIIQTFCLAAWSFIWRTDEGLVSSLFQILISPCSVIGVWVLVVLCDPLSSKSLLLLNVSAHWFDVALEKCDSVFDGHVSEGVGQLGHLCGIFGKM